jgi:hypothetical protein
LIFTQSTTIGNANLAKRLVRAFTQSDAGHRTELPEITAEGVLRIFPQRDFKR